jgi:hypothetical protein
VINSITWGFAAAAAAAAAVAVAVKIMALYLKCDGYLAT